MEKTEISWKIPNGPKEEKGKLDIDVRQKYNNAIISIIKISIIALSIIISSCIIGYAYYESNRYRVLGEFIIDQYNATATKINLQ